MIFETTHLFILNSVRGTQGNANDAFHTVHIHWLLVNASSLTSVVQVNLILHFSSSRMN